MRIEKVSLLLEEKLCGSDMLSLRVKMKYRHICDYKFHSTDSDLASSLYSVFSVTLPLSTINFSEG